MSDSRGPLATRTPRPALAQISTLPFFLEYSSLLSFALPILFCHHAFRRLPVILWSTEYALHYLYSEQPERRRYR